jgi:curved DNA-binding protein CbpA
VQDPYEILQVHRRAEPEVIRAAYRALARKYHPDFGGDASRMAEITEAWSILESGEQRAAFDMQAVRSHTRRSTDRKPSAHARTPDGSARGGPAPGSGSVIDFGRYAGWTVDRLAGHDPDYLEWLARSPIGRRLVVEIDAALATRAAQASALRPSAHATQRRRSIIRPWAAAGFGGRSR